jgi:hypothetical protein
LCRGSRSLLPDRSELSDTLLTQGLDACLTVLTGTGLLLLRLVIDNQGLSHRLARAERLGFAPLNLRKRGTLRTLLLRLLLQADGDIEEPDEYRYQDPEITQNELRESLHTKVYRQNEHADAKSSGITDDEQCGMIGQIDPTDTDLEDV